MEFIFWTSEFPPSLQVIWDASNEDQIPLFYLLMLFHKETQKNANRYPLSPIKRKFAFVNARYRPKLILLSENTIVLDSRSQDWSISWQLSLSPTRVFWSIFPDVCIGFCHSCFWIDDIVRNFHHCFCQTGFIPESMKLKFRFVDRFACRLCLEQLSKERMMEKPINHGSV